MAVPATGPFRAALATRGRKTGREHTVTLRAVYYNGSYYFSRHRPDSDWFRNAAHNGSVYVVVGGERLSGTATVVTDRLLAEKVSQLKYPGEGRAGESRAVIQVTPDE